jgi:hypothetical protein
MLPSKVSNIFFADKKGIDESEIDGLHHQTRQNTVSLECCLQD